MFDLSSEMQTAAYIASTVLFILSLGGLSDQENAKRGVWYGIVGMAIAVYATIFGPGVQLGPVLVVMLIIGTVAGVYVAKKVEMTGMPELVAALHSFVGLAAVFIGINSDISPPDLATNAERAKLAGKVDGKALILPGRHLLNIALVALCVLLLFMYMNHAGSWTLYLMTLLAFIIGAHLVLAIGGADMPVVVSMLNSYSGWAAAATGFLLGNDLLIVTGALVGSSGAILSYIMCKAMNRKFLSVILGGFGGPSGEAMAIEGEQIAIDADGVAASLEDADQVIIVPGYGMAVAQAQQSVSELTRRLRAAGKTVRFGIHPVAGRLPGHMNVLLAEAKVPYDIVLEMDEINDDFPETDVVIVIGSMPVLEVWKAKQVFVSKRGQGTGYSGIENPLFFKENTRMFYGDAKASVDALLQKMS